MSRQNALAFVGVGMMRWFMRKWESGFLRNHRIIADPDANVHRGSQWATRKAGKQGGTARYDFSSLLRNLFTP